MATLYRRKSDGGFYTKINIGGIVTKQVHPDAVRYLIAQGVFVDEEIPSEHMRVLRQTQNWLYTKEEHPFVTFLEHNERTFGHRPKAAIYKRREKNKKPGSPLSEPFSKSGKRRLARQSKKAEMRGLRVEDTAASSEWARAGDRADTILADESTLQLSVAKRAASIESSVKPIGSLDETSGVGSGSERESKSPYQAWLEGGAFLPVWCVILILTAVLLAAYWVSGVIDAHL